MTEADVECILERAKERYHRCAARDHLGQRSEIAKDFKAFIREDRAVLPAIEREALAQDDKIGRPASCQPHEPRTPA